MFSTRVIGLLASNPEEGRGKEAKLSVYVDRVVYSIRKPKHFDVVAYDPLPAKQGTGAGEGGVAVYGKTSMFSWREEDQLVGRIVGLPGDSVELLQGKLRINGRLWAEPYIPAEFQTSVSMPPTHLGTAEYLILSDNRHLLEAKKDDWIVNRDRITGRVLVHKWPIGWAIFSPSAFLHAYPLD